jgi:GAF domain-containing protein
MRRGAKPAKAKVEAEQAVTRKSLKSDGSRVRDLEKRLAEALEQQTAMAELLQTRNRELAEALEQQTATAEVLQAISRSTFDLQPVLETLVENATKLCGADKGFIYRFDGSLFRLAVTYGTTPEVREFIEQHPIPPGRGTVVGRIALEGRPVQIPDVAADPDYTHPMAQPAGWRTMFGVPMYREGALVGAIAIQRNEVRLFTEKQIALVTTFADQAVIAMENVRLFKELGARNHDLTEALEQQTATSEILRVISSSPTDVQPVFGAIMASAVRLCDGLFGAVFQYDGDLIHLVAHHNFTPEVLQLLSRVYPMRPSRVQATGRAILTGTLIHLHDALADPDYLQDIAIRGGWRSMLAVPMSREGAPIGVIWVARAFPRPFLDSQIALLRTFADQAVIAIENARLFQELQARNRALTDALEQQTATGEVLQVISRSAFDLEPVLETLIENAGRLCGADRGHIYGLDGDVLRVAVTYGALPERKDYAQLSPIPLGPGSASGQAASERRTIHIHDVLAAPRDQFRETPESLGYRTVLAIPMVREDTLLGVITIWKTKVEPFTDRQIELVTAFAAQAVIAIDNVRLFQALQTRNGELTESLEQQTATSEILRVISSSPTNTQPVFQAIARSAG